MRPGRDDIAIPPFAPGVSWIGTAPKDGERLTARGPLLVHFFEVGELSSVRTLPFIEALARTYGDSGLWVLGIHSPRSALAQEDETLTAALERLGVSVPVANDREHRIWHGYGCEGWPSTFLWGIGGMLAWVHFGEGAYHETEAAIRAELDGDPADLPDPFLDPPRDDAGPPLERPSDEIFPGGAHDRPWRSRDSLGPLELEYEGAGAWASFDGKGTVGVAIDGEPAGSIDVQAPGLYELSSHDRHGAHSVTIRPDEGLRLWSVSFAPGTRD
jgi:hypothetical protein